MNAVLTRNSLRSLFRARFTLAWLILVAATLVTLRFGADPAHHATSTTIVIVVALVKIRLVGNYFMELREAPTLLRGLFEGYCLGVCALILGLYYGR